MKLNNEQIAVRVRNTEEKASDVNLATWLLLDVMEGRVDKALVISNDADLREPIKQVTKRGCEVVLANPRGHIKATADLQRVATSVRRIRSAAIEASQFPEWLADINGEFMKPDEW